MVVISGCLQSVCVSGCLCFCHFLLSLLTNAFSGMRNPWLKTCALLLGTRIFFGSAMSPREKHRNKENNRNRNLPPVSVPEWEYLLGSLLDFCSQLGLVSVWRGQVSHSNPSASRYKLSGDLQTSLLVYRANYFQNHSLELWISLQNLSRQKPSAAHELSHQLPQVTEEREAHGV